MRCNFSPNYLVALFVFGLLGGCATLPHTQTKQIDHRQTEYALVKNGEPVVVFENGLGGTMDWWKKVFPEIAKDTTVFAYNRPGYGNSEATTTPRDGQHIVDELRMLLRSEGLNPPYMLVGHSLGGLYMQDFARRYPDEVNALILVDSTHPTQVEGKGSPESWSLWLRIILHLAVRGVAKDEFAAVDATGKSVLNLPMFRNPVVVLSAAKPLKETSELANFANDKRRDIARLYPGSKQVWVDSGHAIPLEAPEAIISEIRALLY